MKFSNIFILVFKKYIFFDLILNFILTWFIIWLTMYRNFQEQNVESMCFIIQ